MKKISLSILLCLSLIFSLTACSKDGSVKLGDYSKIEVAKSDVEVTDQDVQDYIDQQLQAKATTTTLTAGTVASGDSINISYTGYVDGETFDGGSAENTPITLGSSGFIDGFDDGLIGKDIGSTVDLNLTFPDPYEANSDLAGKPVLFKVTINSKETTVTPELTDEWVTQNYSDQKLTTVDAFKQYCRTTLEDSALTDAIWEAVFNDVTVESYNEKEKESLIKDQKEYVEKTVSSSYGMELADYLKLIGMTEDDYDKQIESSVKDYLKQKMTVYAIADKEKLSVSDKEYNEQLETYATQQGYSSVDDFKKTLTDNNEEQIKLQLLANKVIDILKQNVSLVDKVEESTEETTAEATEETTTEATTE